MARTQQEELEEMDRVLTKLALTNEGDLEKVIMKLLPLAIQRLDTPHKAVQSKVLGMLSHINKRVKGQKHIALPLESLVAMYNASPLPSPLIRNFALVYIEMAAERASPESRLAIVPRLLQGVSRQPPAQRDILLRLAMGGLAHLVGSSAPRQGDTREESAFAAQYPFLQEPGDRAVFLEFGRISLLYAPTQRQSPKPAAAEPINAAGRGVASHAPASGQPDSDPAEYSSVAAGGLSLADVARVQGKTGPPSVEQLTMQRLGFLNFIAAAGLNPSEVLIPYLIAACDSQDPQARVANRGETLLRKRCGVDSSKPVVDLEDATMMADLFQLFLGSNPPSLQQKVADPSSAASAANGSGANNRGEDSGAVRPVGQAIQLRLLLLFCRSLVAADTFPQALQVIFSCVYETPRSVRLQRAGMEFAVWTFKHATLERLAAIAPLLLNNLMRLLDEDIPPDLAGRALRSFTYQAVGQLATRQPKLVSRDSFVAARLFNALATEPAAVRSAVQEALGALALAYRGCPGSVEAELDEILLKSIEAPDEATRLAAVQWAVRLHSFRSMAARYVCCVAAGDKRLDVREAGLAGLRLPTPKRTSDDSTRRGALSSQQSPPKDDGFPLPADVVTYFVKRHPRLAMPPESLLLPEGTFIALINFLAAAQDAEAAAGRSGATTLNGGSSSSSMTAGGLPAYCGVLEHALVREASPALQDVALVALVDAAAMAPAAFAQRYASRVHWLCSFLGHSSATAREAAAKLCGVTAASMHPDGAAALLEQLRSKFEGGATSRAGKLATAAVVHSGDVTAAGLSANKGSAATARTAAQYEERDGSIAATGFVLAQYMTGTPAVEMHHMSAAAYVLYSVLFDKDASLAASAALALGHVAVRAPLPLSPSAANSNSVTETVTSEFNGASKSVDQAASSALAMDINAGPSAHEEASPMASLRRILKLTQHRDDKVVRRAVEAVGYLASSHCDTKMLSAAAEGFFALFTHKSEQVQLAVGEALCFVFGGVPVSADAILYRRYQGLAAHFTALEQTQQQQDGIAGSSVPGALPHMAVDDDTLSARSPGGLHARASVQDSIMTKLLDEHIFHTRAEVRRGACVALLALLSYTGRPPALAPYLPAIQEAFSGLLGDSNEVTQEMASRGISVVYDMSSPDNRKQLLDDLVGVLQGGPRKRRAVKVDGDTRVFTQGSLPLAPGGGNISTYQELQGLANDLGQPELVYRFMGLANHAAALNSSRGAAFGFAGIAKLAGEQLSPYVAAMVPKLYRYQYDPNPRVRDAMSTIWRALVPEPRATLQAQWLPIVDELLADVGGKLWRNREAACLGLADLLHGQRWAVVEPSFEGLWIMALRALDDIKESVRAAALQLACSLRAFTVRVADQEQSTPKDAAAAVSLALPLLLDKGMCSSVAQVASLAVDTIVQVVKRAGPLAIKPHLPLLIGTLLESLTTLEDTRLNHVEQHAGRLGMDAGVLETARVSASRTSPMGEALDVVAAYVDAAALEKLVPRLGSIAKRAIGVNSRVGAAKFVSSLALRLGTDMRPSSAAIVEAFLTAVKTERSPAVQRALAAAVAATAQYATDAKVDKICQEILNMYCEGSDRASRYIAALLARELAKSTSEAFARHAATVLPTAFVGKYDEDKDIAALWADVWEDSTSAEAIALRMYMNDIVPLIIAGLKSQQWGWKKSVADAAAVAAQVAPESLAPFATAVSSALQAELPGRVWEGKAAVVMALAAVMEACPGAMGRHEVIAAVQALVGAVGRGNEVYQRAVLTAMTRILRAFPNQDHLEAVASPLIAALTAHAHQLLTKQSASTVPTVDAAGAVRALGAAWAAAGADSVQSRGRDVAQAIAATLLPGQPWAVQLEGLTVARTYIAKLRGIPSGQLAIDVLVSWVLPLVPGLLACTENIWVSAVRLAAIAAIGELAAATHNTTHLPTTERAAITSRLHELMHSERSVAIAAEALCSPLPQ